MKWWLIVLAMVLFCSPTGAQETLVPVVGGTVITSPAAATPQAGRLRILERRRMGLTVRNVVRVLQQMKADGELAKYVSVGEDGSKEIDVSTLAAGVADRLATEKPADWKDIDWDKIIDFLEKLLELLLKFLPIIFDLFT